jgi:hypothetical protein
MRWKKNQWTATCAMTSSFRKTQRRGFNEHDIVDAFYDRVTDGLRAMKVSNTAHWTVMFVKPTARRRLR